MGRPLNKRNFGAPGSGNEIKVQFHNGTASVDGYIIKQLGSRRFRCSDGTTEADCRLVDKLAASLAAGEMTISVKDDAAVVHHAIKLTGRKATLGSTGEAIKWNYSDSTTDAAVEVEDPDVETFGAPIGTASAVNGVNYEILTLGTTNWAAHDASGDQSPYSVGDRLVWANGIDAGSGTIRQVFPGGDQFGT